MTITIDRPTETDTVAPAKISLPYSTRLLGGMFAVALHVAKNDVTAIVETVRVDARTFIATDRFSVGEWTHTPTAESASDPSTNQKDDPKGYVLIPRSAAEWLAKQSPKVLAQTEMDLTAYRPEDVEYGRVGAIIEFEPTSITITLDGMTLAVTRFAEVGGNFPPVARLFPGEEPVQAFTGAPFVALNPAFVERFTKGAARVNVREAPLRMTLQATSNLNKPGPVLFEFGNSGDGQSFRGLLQPNLMTR